MDAEPLNLPAFVVAVRDVGPICPWTSRFFDCVLGLDRYNHHIGTRLVKTDVKRKCEFSGPFHRFRRKNDQSIAAFPILAATVDAKKGDQLCETVSQPSIRPDKVDPPMGS